MDKQLRIIEAMFSQLNNQTITLRQVYQNIFFCFVVVSLSCLWADIYFVYFFYWNFFLNKSILRALILTIKKNFVTPDTRYLAIREFNLAFSSETGFCN